MGCRYGLTLCLGVASILSGQFRQSTSENIHGISSTAEGLSPPAVRAIAANGNHSLALDSDGTVWEWGGKWSAPTRVNGLTGIVSVAAGVDYGLAVRYDGTVWAWGANDVGQLGDGTTTSRPTPVQVAGLTDVVGVSARPFWERGGDALWNVAVRSDGTVWAWGFAWESQGIRLGPPKQVAGLSGVVMVAADNDRSMALRADGTVWAWKSDWSRPMQVTGLDGVVSIAPGGGGIALRHDGTLWVLGDLTGVRLNGIDGVVAVSGSALHNLAVKRDGTVWSWNWSPLTPYANLFGQLGDGTTENRTTPSQVSGLTDVVSVAAGGLHSLALKSDGTLWAWGWDGQGQLGTGRSPWRSVPGEVNGLNDVVAIFGHAVSDWVSSGSYGFALKRDGTLWVWGAPYGSAKYCPLPEMAVSGFTGGVTIAGYTVLKDDGTVWTWRPGGFPNWFNLPLGQPVQVRGIEGVAAIAQSGLVLRKDGTVWRTRYPEGQVQGLERIVAIASDNSEWNLAVREDGTVWQWFGWPPYMAGAPAQVSELDSVVGVATGSYYWVWPWAMPGDSCPNGEPCETTYRQALALKADGTVWEWRQNINPWRRSARQTDPVQVSGLTGVARVATSASHSLALRVDGTVWAWGTNDSGQLGDGTTTSRATPVQVAGLTGVVAIAASSTHSLALRRDGSVWSWGQNDSGQLGDDRTIMRSTPVQVIQPGSPDLSIKVGHNDDFAVGSRGVYLLTIANAGLAPAPGKITVTDILRPGLTYVSATGASWNCSAIEETVTCTHPGPLEPGAATSITLTVNVGSAAWPGVTNFASVDYASDRNTGNNAIGDPTVVLPRPL